MSKHLLIMRCRDPQMWYAHKVGMIVPYLGTYPECYKSRQDEGYINIVHFVDAVIVEDDENVCSDSGQRTR